MMSKVILNPSHISRIVDIIKTNGIVSAIVLHEEQYGIGNVVTMSWETMHNGYETTMTVVVTDEKDW